MAGVVIGNAIPCLQSSKAELFFVSFSQVLIYVDIRFCQTIIHLYFLFDTTEDNERSICTTGSVFFSSATVLFKNMRDF